MERDFNPHCTMGGSEVFLAVPLVSSTAAAHKNASTVAPRYTKPSTYGDANEHTENLRTKTDFVWKRELQEKNRIYVLVRSRCEKAKSWGTS